MGPAAQEFIPGHEVKVGEPIFLRNLLLFPLTNGRGRIDDIGGIDDLIARHLGQIKELEPPAIDMVSIENRSDQRLLMIDGEEIMGAMQNRIVAASHLIEANTSIAIPAVCVEEGRWQADDSPNTFFSGRSVSYPTLRALLATSKIRSQRRRGEDAKESSQKKIWKEIKRKLAVTRVSSFTSSMHDIYETLEDEVSRYLEGCRGFDETCGLIAVAAKKFLALDLFGSNQLFKIFREKLLKSYIIDALEYRNQTTVIPKELPDKIFTDFKRARAQTIKTTGLGTERHLFGKNTLGRALIYENKPIHLSLFPRND